MKYTIHGFSQQKAIELGLDDRDLMILRWFVDYKDTGKMVKKILDNDMYYWIKYEGIQEAFPIINWKKDTIYRRLKAMALKGVLKHKTVKEFGTYSFYAIGPNYLGLTDTKYEMPVGNKSDSSEINPIATELNPRVTELNPKETEINPKETEINPEHNINLLNSSIKNSSIKNSSIKDIIEYFWKNRINLDADSIDLLSDQVKIHGEDTVKKAVDVGTKNGTKAVSYKYIEGILKNWSVNGVPEDKEEINKKIFDF